MRIIRLLILLSIFAGCNPQQDDQSQARDTLPSYDTASTAMPAEDPHIHGKDTVDVFSNKRFKNVYVEKLSDTSFRVTGQAQVFEAAYSWVVEDGHEELLTGYGMTDAGAPEFGNFSFVLNVKKKKAQQQAAPYFIRVQRERRQPPARIAGTSPGLTRMFAMPSISTWMPRACFIPAIV